MARRRADHHGVQRVRGTHDVRAADHGVDPTTPGSDHTREYSPLLALGLSPGRYDGLQEDVGATAFVLLTGERPPLAGQLIGGGG